MDYYQTLGVPREATQDQIKKAYRRLAMKHHPDRGGDEDAFKPISEAHEVLMDEEKRAYYDEHGKPPPKGPDFEAMAFQVLTEWFIKIGNNCQWAKGPYVRDIRKQNAQTLNKLENEEDAIAATRERVEKLSMTVPGGEENPLGGALEKVKKELEAAAEKNTIMLQVHRKIEALMEPYEDDYIEPQQMTQVFTFTTNSSSTTW